jgi:hypothetical protein
MRPLPKCAVRLECDTTPLDATFFVSFRAVDLLTRQRMLGAPFKPCFGLQWEASSLDALFLSLGGSRRMY